MYIDFNEFKEKVPDGLLIGKSQDIVTITTTQIVRQERTICYAVFKFLGKAAERITSNGSFLYSNPRFSSKMYFKQPEEGTGYKISFKNKIPTAHATAFYSAILERWQGIFPLCYDLREKMYFITLADVRRFPKPNEEELEDEDDTPRREKYLYEGEMLSLRQIAQKEGISYRTFYYRVLETGLPVPDAIALIKGGQNV